MSSSATTNITMKLVRTPRQTPLHPPPCCTTAAQWPSDPTSERDRDQRGTLRYAARPASAAPAWGRHHSVPVGARAPRSLARARECPGRTPNYEVVVEFTSLIAAFIVGSPTHILACSPRVQRSSLCKRMGIPRLDLFRCVLNSQKFPRRNPTESLSTHVLSDMSANSDFLEFYGRVC